MKTLISTSAIIAAAIISAASSVSANEAIGYTVGSVDPALATAASKTSSSVIIDEVLYSVGYSVGQVDPALAAAVK